MLQDLLVISNTQRENILTFGLIDETYSTYPFCLPLIGLLNFFVWLRITDESSVPEMSFWSIFLIKSDLKWCIHLRRRLFLNLQRKLK